MNFHILNDNSYYHILDCNKESLNILQQELFKRLIKPLYYIALAISACFLFLISKENINHKLNRSIIFLFGTFILILSELTSSLSSKSIIYFQFSIILPIIIILILYLYLYKKINYSQ